MRIRRVKGNIIKRTGGDYNMYAGEDIITTSNGPITETAGEGITYGEPEKYIPYQPENTINIYVGMFFDGTGNNRYNSDQMYYKHVTEGEVYIKAKTIPTSMETFVGKNKDVKVKISDSDSYWNPYSNIAKLFDLYKEQKEPKKNNEYPEYGTHVLVKQYVEGIGTLRDKEDDILGSAMGRGDWGVISRVEQGIKDLVEDQLKGFPREKKIYKIVFDVFGFSRGAAAARHFCNEVKKKGTILGKELKNHGFLSANDSFKIEIRYLGLFDTVVADMIVKERLAYKAGAALATVSPGIGAGVAAGGALLPDIKTSLKGLGIGSVFHITANDEIRENFALTLTNSGTSGYSLGIPGCHSDVGGGYAHLDKYEAVVDLFDITAKDEQLKKEKEAVRQYYIDKGFSTEEQIKMVNTYDHIEETQINSHSQSGFPITRKKEAPANFPDKGERIMHGNRESGYNTIYQKKLSDHYIIKDSRYISNKYPLVPMYLMLEDAIEDNIPFYKDYKEAIKNGARIDYPFEQEIPNTDKYKVLKEYLELMQDARKATKNSSLVTTFYNIPTEMRRHIYNN